MISPSCRTSAIAFFWKSDTNHSLMPASTADRLGHIVSLQVVTTTSKIREDQSITFFPTSIALPVRDQTTNRETRSAPMVAATVEPKATMNIIMDNERSVHNYIEFYSRTREVRHIDKLQIGIVKFYFTDIPDSVKAQIKNRRVNRSQKILNCPPHLIVKIILNILLE